MNVAAAIRINSPDEERVIRRAAEFAEQQHSACFVISVVPRLPYGTLDGDADVEAVRRNLELISQSKASPVMQEGNDIPRTLLTVACAFGVRTLFLQSGTSHLLGRSIAEQLLYLEPPFDVVVVNSG